MKNQPWWPVPTLVCLPMIAMTSPVLAAETELSPLVVHARHWQENVTGVPMSVLVDQAEPTRNPLWHDLQAIAERAANTQIENSSVQKRIVVRGITAANTGLQDPVGYFVDGVALPLGANQAPYIFNQEHIELIKGPQGALYGRNTEAGAFKVVTRKPGAQPESWMNLSHIWVDGQNDRQNRDVLAAGLSGPLNAETLAAGLAVRVEEGNTGYLNVFDQSTDGGQVDRYTLSARVDWLLSAATDISLRSTVEKDDSGMARMRYQTGPFTTPRQTTNYNVAAEQERQTGVHALTVNHYMDAAELTAITGVTHFDRNFVMDLDAATLPSPPSLLDLNNRMFSQEFRLTSPLDTEGRKWLLGSYLFTEKSDIDFSVGAPSTRRQTTIDQNGIALFGQMEFPLSERLTLAVGSRLEHLKQKGQQEKSNLFGRSHYTATDSQVELLPRLDMTYQATDDLTLYANVARGYLPGGYNYNLAGDADSFTYDAEYSDTAELGIKGALLDGRVNTELALFYTRSTDKQIVDLIPGGLQRISNAAEARIYGVEIALDTPFGNGWRAFADVGWQQAEATEYQSQTLIGGAAVIQDLSGNDLPMAAPFSYSLGVTYEQSQGLYGQIRLKGSDSFFFDSHNTLEQSAYETVDLEIGYTLNDMRISIAGRNLLDENHYTRALNTPNGVLVEDAAPREISLSLSAKW